ncbi:glycosyltransferase [Bradyrhizobium sp.]|uniref:glycosyltransferase n=1 Tax=Bradyrhizobium sp. TaxID=376 RepID=UPI001E069236|nr:glycosyltransferase [Bradyrhizobium sp.]MBI5321089.1 glycosyltransferase [Bradyrhizobium sp.]
MVRNVISYYALSADFQASISLGHPDQTNYVVVSRAREQGLIRVAIQARSLKAESTVVAIEDASSSYFAGPLILLAAMISSGRVAVMWPDRILETVSWGELAKWALKIAKAQVSSRFAYWRSRRLVQQFAVRRPPTLSPVANRSRRILYLDANLPIGREVGGSVGHTSGVINAFAARSYRVDYASGRTAVGLSGALQFKVPYAGHLAMPPELNCYSFNEGFELCARRLLAEHSYAFIYQRMSVHNFTGACLRRETGIPFVLEYNGSEAWAAANWNKRLRFHDMAVSAERASLRNADLVVTVSDALTEEVVAAGVDRERIVAYPNCVDPAIFDPNRFSLAETGGLREKLGIRGDARVATFIGTFGAWHGVVFLARAIRRLIDDHLAWVEARKLHFLLIGDGLKSAEVRSLLADEPYSRFATLTGTIPQAEAPLYLASSDIFLCPTVPNVDGSAFFGSPTKLFEYMAMERPIVASDLDQIGKVLRGELCRGGLLSPMAELFRPGDEEDFLKSLRKVVEDTKFASDIAASARISALGCFTWTHHVDAILARARSLGIMEE